MFENDSIQAFHQKPAPKAKKMQAMGLPAKDKRDEFIMDTNNSSIVSKRSVEKLYYAGQPEYFRYFVKKFQRRSPLINRGYWLRMRAIDHVVRLFLAEKSSKKKVVINLGCGYDPLPFQYLGNHPDLCQDATFVDVDYPQLMARKLQMIQQHSSLLELLPGLRASPAGQTLVAQSEKYLAVGCDLRQLDKLEAVLRDQFQIDECAVAMLFVAEVSVAYMDLEPANDVLRWASKFDDVQFCLLEQHLPDGPDHPFAQTMLKHFEKLRTPLRAIGKMDDMFHRFSQAGWPEPGIDIRTLWELWSNPSFLTPKERQDLDTVEPFDEWEELALFGSHYFLLVAQSRSRGPDTDYFGPRQSSGSNDAKAVKHKQSWQASPLDGKSEHRRFGATLSVSGEKGFHEALALHGGLGTRERLNTYDVYSTSSEQQAIKAPPLPLAVMCHTITALGGQDAGHLLIGGRSSPDKASAACWLYHTAAWSRVHDLPHGRYRHCAQPITFPAEQAGLDCGVLVFGGKNSRGSIQEDWLWWDGMTGWTTIKTPSVCLEARFGAAMSLFYGETSKGILTGGMRQDGTVINDCWEWNLQVADGHRCLTLNDRSKTLSSEMGGNEHALGRFGAALVPSQHSFLLIGGVTGGKMLDRTNEVVNLVTGECTGIRSEDRPLLVGFAALGLTENDKDIQDSVLILGGGATCFSFGTFWNNAAILVPAQSSRVPAAWRLQEPKASDSQSRVSDSNVPLPGAKLPNNPAHSDQPQITLVPRKIINTAADFDLLRSQAQPVILEGLDLGTCTDTWTIEYLREKVGADRNVVIHTSPSAHMNFQTKNFSYTTQPFGDFLEKTSRGEHVYLRALSADKPAEKPTDLSYDFPTIADDFRLPPELQYATTHAHSSPLRISGPVTMWLHYDVMANVLCQIRGSKRLLLYKPSDVIHLSFPPGASSSLLNPFTSSAANFPGMALATPYEAHLRPGDVLFIPPLWLHTAEPTDGLSVAVNVFFRDDAMEVGYAAGRDVYGNRDLAAYERGRRDVQRIAKSFEGLPEQAKKFYVGRLADELAALARTE